MKGNEIIQFNAKYGIYVSDRGRVFRGVKEGTLRELRRSTTNSGYVQVGFALDGRPCTALVHRLVAETFIPNPEGLRDVDHADGDRRNNRADNLRWMSHAENCRAAFERRKLVGRKNGVQTDGGRG